MICHLVNIIIESMAVCKSMTTGGSIKGYPKIAMSRNPCMCTLLVFNFVILVNCNFWTTNLKTAVTSYTFHRNQFGMIKSPDSLCGSGLHADAGSYKLTADCRLQLLRVLVPQAHVFS